MASARALAWLDRLVWILIYAGLFAIVLGFATLAYDDASAWALLAAGGVLVAAGAILIWVRSRVRAGD